MVKAIIPLNQIHSIVKLKNGEIETLNNMKNVFVLEHIYEQEEQDEIKFIGIFSSLERAQDVIEELRFKNGFKNFPVDCFKISESIIDNYEWKDGFIPWEEA